MLARRSFSIATSRVRLPMSEQKIASVVNGVSKAVEAHANPIVTADKADTQKSTGILRNPNMTLTSEAIARGRLATLDRRTDQARLEQMHADGGLTLILTPSLTRTLTPSLSLTLPLILTRTLSRWRRCCASAGSRCSRRGRLTRTLTHNPLL